MTYEETVFSVGIMVAEVDSNILGSLESCFQGSTAGYWRPLIPLLYSLGHFYMMGALHMEMEYNITEHLCNKCENKLH